MNDFEKHFEKLVKTDDASTLWINWLDWVIKKKMQRILGRIRIE